MKKKASFEDAIQRLEEIIDLLNTGKAPLEESLKLYAESAKLLAFCNTTLEKAKLTVEEVFPESKTEESEGEDVTL